MSRRGWVVVLAGLIALGAGLGTALWPGGRRVDPVAGARLYAEYCASCHGAALEGEANWRERRADGTLPAPPHDASGHTWHHPDEQLFDIVKLGTAALVGGGYKTTMRGFGDELGDAEIRSILAYIRSRWPEEIRRRQADITARAKAGG